MKRKLTTILVTGGAGFIGANFIHYLFSKESGFDGKVINLDLLTYCGNVENLTEIEKKHGANGTNRYFFERADISNYKMVKQIFDTYAIDTVVHFAAESHVDRSIHGPEAFVKTNVLGTFNLLEVAKKAWTSEGNMRNDVLFHHVSTDEVYGSLGTTGFFSETTAYDPRSPYSASKASSDHLVMAYFHTYGLPVTISNCSNNYGPYQFPEKLIPLMIMNIKEGKNLPVYGDGRNVRDWIYVEDHNRAVHLIMKNGRIGETYAIGGESEWENIVLLKKIIEISSKLLNKNKDEIEKTITFVQDRLGHDRRYAIDCTKIKTELGWKRNKTFEEGLTETIRWYLQNESWTKNIKSGEYQKWIEKNYTT